VLASLKFSTMNWAPMSANPPGLRGAPAMMTIPACCGVTQENQARPKFHRTLSDITNITGVRGGSKQPLLDPKTPARRTKSGSDCGFAVFEDGPDYAQSAPRRPASPPHVRPKSRGGDEDCILGESNQMIGIEELAEADLPPIQDFADRVSEQDQYWDAFGLDDGPDGFGRPEDLARMLGHGTARACFEADASSSIWAQDIAESSVPCPSSEELNKLAWQCLSPSPKRKLAEPGVGVFGIASSPLLPPLDVEMDIDSDWEDAEDAHSNPEAHRPLQVGEPMAL